MKLVFGLGNPGTKFDGTRHNIGFFVLDSFVKEQGGSFSDKPKFFAQIAEGELGGEKVIFAKPETFYNESGRSYRALLDFYKVSPEDTLIVHDELALPFGTVRVREGGSDAGNNGIKSINAYGGEASKRVRVGVSNDSRSLIGDVDFVLGRLSQDETKALIYTIYPKIHGLIEDFTQGILSVSSTRL
jgi:PTH1 family peptidyl-tRNA hydrolase